jgi:hypothetical protein
VSIGAKLMIRSTLLSSLTQQTARVAGPRSPLTIPVGIGDDVTVGLAFKPWVRIHDVDYLDVIAVMTDGMRRFGLPELRMGPASPDDRVPACQLRHELGGLRRRHVPRDVRLREAALALHSSLASGPADKVIPPALLESMAQRAKAHITRVNAGRTARALARAVSSPGSLVSPVDRA